MYAQEAVKKDVAEEYAKSIGGGYRCVSALKSTGINELFDLVGRSFLQNDEEVHEQNEEKKEKNEKNEKEESKQEFTLKPEDKETKKKNRKKKCC